MILYEVNFEFPKAQFEFFSEWFDNHMAEILASDTIGFVRGERFLREETYEGKTSDVGLVTAHYYVTNRAALQNFFDKNADQIRTKGASEIAGKITLTATRRILIPDDKCKHAPKFYSPK